MPKKLQQFYVRKLDSRRLKEHNYNIKNLSLQQSRLNGELVSISNSEMIRTLFRITNKPFSQFELNNLWNERKRISNRRNNKTNREKLEQINKRIDEFLYIPELISIKFSDKRHYKNIIEKGGFQIDKKLYVPFMSSAGMVRRNSALFIDAQIKKEITGIFNNGRNLEKELIPAKFNAYFALYSSSSFPVSFPRIAIVPDKIIKTNRRVDYSVFQGEGIDPIIEERDMELECNAFDGQGLISPKFAKLWQSDLELDYLPSTFIIRAPFLKGMLVTFPFHELAEKFHVQTIKDIYGEEIKLKDIDVLISESQFKLWESYLSTKDYLQKCEENKLGWGITRYSPKDDKTFARSSYQFLQVLDLEDKDIRILCKPTLDWLRNISGGDIASILLYMMGEVEYSNGWFEHLEPLTQALLLENEIIKDSYLISHLDNSVSKKKTDGKMGRLLFSGNYSIVISDPYYQTLHAFGIEGEPLLKDRQHYSHYWNERGVEKVIAIRSPIVHSSEVNLLNLQNNDEVNYWYQYIKSGIIFPAYGIGLDAAINGGSD